MLIAGAKIRIHQPDAEELPDDAMDEIVDELEAGLPLIKWHIEPKFARLKIKVEFDLL